MTLDHDAITELLGAFALNAVDEVERSEIERHLLDCPRCRAEVDDHREVVALIANTGATAPEGVWTRIESSLVETPPPLDMNLLGDRPSTPSPPVIAAREDTVAPVIDLASRRRVPLLLSGAAAIVALIVGVAIGSFVGAESGDAPVQFAASLDDAARAAMNDVTSTRVPLVAADGETTVDAVVTADGQGYLVGTTLASLDVDLAYQLWGIRNGVAVSLGVLGNSPSVVAFPATTEFDALALTIEKAGGVVSSAEPAAFVGTIS